ncbi:MAG: alcohol dehydrogenase catalytic domain-containing protein [Alphaproteobacteria bacterium]|nr:alcohol dehydrogenase catalytic domain-containing protein [Alphaproteobacteria bacterium]
MRAARFHARRDVRVENVDKPSRLLADEVLVKNHFAGICGTDLHEYESGPIFISEKPNVFSGASIPQILGHEFSGVIEAVGGDVNHLRPGDRVAIQPHMGPADGYFGVRGLHFLASRGAATGLTWPWGGFAEYAVMKAYATVRMPDEMTFRQGAMVEPSAVAVTAVDKSGLRPGGSVLITGGGPIGVLASMAADAAGASRIFLSEPNEARRHRIASLGLPIELINPNETPVRQTVREKTFEELGCDCAIECSGNPRAISDCIASLRSQGTAVLVGLSNAKVEIDPFEMIIRDIRLQGSLCYPTTLWPRVYSMIQSGKLPVDRVVDAEIALDDLIEKGFEPLLDPNGSMLKILVDISNT